MGKPQQPEIARSGRGATDPASVKSALSAPSDVRPEGDTGPVPEENAPGHRPDRDQDKPSGERYVRKVRQHAADRTSLRADRAARVAGMPFRVAAGAIRRVRDRLPD